MLSLGFPRELAKLKAGRRQDVNATNESYIPFGADSKNYTLLAVCRNCKWAFKEWKKNSRKKDTYKFTQFFELFMDTN